MQVEGSLESLTARYSAVEGLEAHSSEGTCLVNVTHQDSILNLVGEVGPGCLLWLQEWASIRAISAALENP